MSTLPDVLQTEDISLIFQALSDAARENQDLQAALLRMGMVLTALGQTAAPPAAEPEQADEPGVPPVETKPSEPAEPALAPEAIRQLVSGGTLLPEGFKPKAGEMSKPQERDARYAGVDEGDLPLIRDRCRIKAQGARWAFQRRGLLAESADFPTEIAPRDEEVIRDARALPDCYLWMNRPDGPQPSDPRLFDRLAACFENVATAIDLVIELRREDQNPEEGAVEEALQLLAEAQSALRVAAAGVGYDRDDTDQERIHRWLRVVTRDERVYLKRHMKIDDPADPADWGDLAQRLEAFDADLQKQRDAVRDQKRAFSRIRYHLGQIQDRPDQDHAHDWSTIIATVDSVIQNGVAPSSVELRDLILPVLEQIPEDVELPRNFELMLREIDAFLATREAEPREMRQPETPTPEVAAVAEKLAGKQIFLIGGIRRPKSHAALKQVFGLEDVIWFETPEHESVSKFEPYVNRPEVAVVLLAIRWSSHDYDGVKAFCDSSGKPLVRLPAGYSPNQVAHQIMKQASDRL